MKMWSMKVIILLLSIRYACLSPNKTRVSFVSRNFNNTLHWDPAKITFRGEKHTYTVKYKNDAVSDDFQIKAACQNINALSCDLTAETPAVHDARYWAKVCVNGRPHGHTDIGFRPIADTRLGAPTVSTHTTLSSLHVKVTLPLGPNGVSMGEIIARSKNGPSKIVIFYNLTITQPKWAAKEFINTTGQFAINLKNSQTIWLVQYCGHVNYWPSTEHGRKKSEKASFCVTLPGDPLMLLIWFLITAVLLVAIVITSVVCMCNYVKGIKESLPQKLVTTSGPLPRVLQLPDENLYISKFEVCPQRDKKVYTTDQLKPNVSSVETDGYSPQDTPCQPWQESSDSSMETDAHSANPNPEDTSAQSSEVYGVVASPVPSEEHHFHQATFGNTATGKLTLFASGGCWDEGGMSLNLTLHGVPPLAVPDSFDDSPDRQLLLRTARDSDGKLMLPLLSFHLDSSTGDPQRKPCLSDLIDPKMEGPSLASLQSLESAEWSDSGCVNNSLNTPTQTYCNIPSEPVVPEFQQKCLTTPPSDGMFESGYKQNWMPQNVFETAPRQSEYKGKNYPCNWTGLRKDVEEDENTLAEDGSRLRELLLGSWVVQVQE